MNKSELIEIILNNSDRPFTNGEVLVMKVQLGEISKKYRSVATRVDNIKKAVWYQGTEFNEKIFDFIEYLLKERHINSDKSYSFNVYLDLLIIQAYTPVVKRLMNKKVYQNKNGQLSINKASQHLIEEYEAPDAKSLCKSVVASIKETDRTKAQKQKSLIIRTEKRRLKREKADDLMRLVREQAKKRGIK